MSTRINPDLDVYALLHEELLAQQLAFPVDRRVADRKRFDWIQWLAEYDGKQMPTAAEFRHVRCYDLSPQGFSFLCDNQPQQNLVIIALGRVPFSFYVARVVHIADIEHQSQQQLKIGCQFVSKVI
jgi:hypothetical protein